MKRSSQEENIRKKSVVEWVDDSYREPSDTDHRFAYFKIWDVQSDNSLKEMSFDVFNSDKVNEVTVDKTICWYLNASSSFTTI